MLINDLSILKTKIEATIYFKRKEFNFKFSSEKNQKINYDMLNIMISDAWKNSGHYGRMERKVRYNDRQMVYCIRFSYFS